MKFLIEKKITLILFFSAIVLISVVMLFYYNTQKVKYTSKLVEHTQDVLRKSDDVLLDVLNVETGLRGFVLSGHEIFLEPYNAACRSINGNKIGRAHV